MTIEALNKSLIYNTSDPYFVDDIPVYPIPISEIRKIGYDGYMARLYWLCITEHEIHSMVVDVPDGLTPFGFLVLLLETNVEIRKIIVSAFQLVTHAGISWNLEELKIYTDDFVITEDNFLKFQKIVCERNLYKTEEIHENPSNEKARQLLERSKQLKEKMRKLRGDEDGVTIADIISICAAKSHVHPDEMGKYDLYQINDLIGRLKMEDDYTTGIESLLHGAKKEDVDLSYWIGKNVNLLNGD